MRSGRALGGAAFSLALLFAACGGVTTKAAVVTQEGGADAGPDVTFDVGAPDGDGAAGPSDAPGGPDSSDAPGGGDGPRESGPSGDSGPIGDSGPKSLPWGVDNGGGTFLSLAVDSQQNVVAAGLGYSPNGGNYPSFYVQKLAPNGLPKWHKSIFSSVGFKTHEAFQVAVDASDAVYLTGLTLDSIDLGGPMPMTQGEFLVKYDAGGNFVWQLGPYAYGNVQFGCAFIAQNGDFVVGGSLQGSQDFGGGTITSAGATDALLLEVTAAGQYVRAHLWGDSAYQSITACGGDAGGHVYMGGSFEGSLDFGGGAMTGPASDNTNWNLFLAALDASFGYVGEKQLNTVCHNCPVVSTVPDRAGHVFVAGSTDATLDLGGGKLQPPGTSAIWLGELDASLAHVWSTVYGDASYAAAGAIALAPGGDVMVAGEYTGNMNFGCGMLPAPSSGQETGIVVHLDPLGNCVHDQPLPGGAPFINGIAYLTPPDVVIAGSFSQQLSLPSGALTSNPSATSDGFVARLEP